MVAASSQLQHELEQHILQRTARRVRGLTIELGSDQVVLHGRVASYHLKQLAQEGVLDVLPLVHLDNEIIVETL